MSRGMNIPEDTQRKPNRTSFTGDNEWFTPLPYIDRARIALKGIDLDPASHPLAQNYILANEFYTKENNGLDKPWHGRVWLNPPYAQPLISQFVDKLVTEYTDGRCTAAVMLTHNYTDTAWFQKAANISSVICFPKGRIRFVSPEGKRAAPTQGQAFMYFGSNPQQFAQSFYDLGLILAKRWV